MLCAIKGKIKETQELIAFGDDVNELSSKGNTALIYAAINNQLDIVEYLIKSGANTSIKSSTNMTALDIAEKYKHGNVAEFLKSHINKS